ncbi:MAG: SBBP repeat-containing protein [Candidatus Thorarchaeota archaeon]
MKLECKSYFRFFIINIEFLVLVSLITITMITLTPQLQPSNSYSNTDQKQSSFEIDEPLNTPVDRATPSNLDKTVSSALWSGSLSFQENQGQFGNSAVRYYFNGRDFGIAFSRTGVTYKLTSALAQEKNIQASLFDLESSYGHEHPSLSSGLSTYINIVFDNSNAVQPMGREVHTHMRNYLIGNAPDSWVTGVRSYARVLYEELYSGVDLIYYFTADGLKYEFRLQNGADPAIIRMRYKGVDELEIDELGNLVARTAAGPLQDQNLLIYQNTAHGQHEIRGQFILLDRLTVGFQILEPYDQNRPLIIDPLVWSTFLGGASGDLGYALALDTADNVYVTGHTADSIPDFPTTPGAFNTSHSGFDDVFVAKFSANGTRLLYSTFIGGSGPDFGYALTLDNANNTYLTGLTTNHTIDFPTTAGAVNTTHNGNSDVFVTKLSADGTSLLFSTLLGGSGVDVGYAIALDPSNNVYVTGYTEDAATDFPTTVGAFNTSHNGGNDVFVTKLSADGTSLLYSTFLGGSGMDEGRALMVDGAMNTYVTGHTEDHTTDFPTTVGAINTSHNGIFDVFILKLSPSGGSLLYSTFLGGSGVDFGYALAMDGANNVYITGSTDDATTDFPTTVGAVNTTHSGGSDVYIAIISADGTSLRYSTFLGGSGLDQGNAIALDSDNNIYVTGFTEDHTTDFPVTTVSYDGTHNGAEDVFVSKLDANGTALRYSTFLGGSGSERGNALAVNDVNMVYVGGNTGDAIIDFPATPGAVNTTHNGGTDLFAFLIRIPTVTSPPVGLSAGLAGNQGVVLFWNAPSNDGDAPVTSYRIYRSTTSGSYGVLLAETSILKLWFNDSTVVSGQTYYYVATAINGMGESVWSNEVSITLLAAITIPGVPQNVSTSAGRHFIVITWDLPTSDGGSAIIHYKVYRGTMSGEYLLLGISINRQFNDTTAVGGITYYYTVTALNAVGESFLSMETSKTALMEMTTITTTTIVTTSSTTATPSVFPQLPLILFFLCSLVIGTHRRSRV